MATQWISRDYVFAALEMNTVLQHYDIDPKQGSSFRIHCPFHEDERPSCSVNRDAKVFNCFGCGEQGNVLDFIAAMEGMDPETEFRAVLEKAIEIIGHNPTPPRGKRNGTTGANKPSKGQSLAKAVDGATPKAAKARKGTKAVSASNDANAPNQAKPDLNGSERCDDPNDQSPVIPKKKGKRSKGKKTKPKVAGVTQMLKSSAEASQPEPNRVLEVPAFPLKLDARHPWLDEQLKRIGVSHTVAAELGIGFEGRSNALMAGRVCFPIHNAKGELVAYAGRWASDERDSDGRFHSQSGREQSRYRLPKGFSKQLELYNWHRIAEQFGDSPCVVLVEGFWSVLRLHASCVPAVGLMGTALSDAHIRLLLEGGIRSVIVIMDGDDEGRGASAIIAAQLSAYFFTRCIMLPNGIKPDEMDDTTLTIVKSLCAGTWELSPSVTEPGLPFTGKAPSKTDHPEREDSPSRVQRDDDNPDKGDLLTKERPKRGEQPQATRDGFGLPVTRINGRLGWP